MNKILLLFFLVSCSNEPNLTVGQCLAANNWFKEEKMADPKLQIAMYWKVLEYNAEKKRYVVGLYHKKDNVLVQKFEQKITFQNNMKEVVCP